ncbi:hypothetical protein BD310DRAFT_940941 [Dichomitus squalens]|uniref:Uncharacterized protein n=1 Tax=Dichomitus squalens TaxID=114155 RepID=A0A4Q9PBN3_9APHY|nr:hypothetical protein BD310DRAFT_940941 [Dichomitus squalens]
MRILEDLEAGDVVPQTSRPCAIAAISPRATPFASAAPNAPPYLPSGFGGGNDPPTSRQQSSPSARKPAGRASSADKALRLPSLLRAWTSCDVACRFRGVRRE